MKSLLAFMKATIMGGVLFLVPLIVITFVLGKALQIAIKVAEPLAHYIPVGRVAGIAIADLIACGIIVFVCFVAGIFARSTRARAIMEKAENKVLWKLPGYGFVKGVTESLVADEKGMSLRPVLVRFDDNAQVAFEVERLPGGEVVVFLPSSPDPWSGGVAIMEASRVEALPGTMLATVQNLRQLGRGTQQILVKGGSRRSLRA
jgi:uncharacterized membrane protein